MTTETTINITHFRKGVHSNGGNTCFWQRQLTAEAASWREGRKITKTQPESAFGWVLNPDWVGPWVLVDAFQFSLTSAYEAHGHLGWCRPMQEVDATFCTLPSDSNLNLGEEHSMDQCQSRPKLSENFERHWSIPISGEIHMDQSLVHTFSWGNSYGPMILKVLRKFLPALAHWHWSMDGSSQNLSIASRSEFE